MADEMERYLFGQGDPIPRGVYCDCTAGAGGHARRILATRGRMHADRDPTGTRMPCGAAGRSCPSSAVGSGTFTAAFPSWPRRPRTACRWSGSWRTWACRRLQLDDGHRGFSLRNPGPLDMRYDPPPGAASRRVRSIGAAKATWPTRCTVWRTSASAAASPAPWSERVRFATPHTCPKSSPRLCRAAQRGASTPQAKTFQALRMAVNDELGELGKLLAEDAAPARSGRPLRRVELSQRRRPLGEAEFPAACQGRNISPSDAPGHAPVRGRGETESSQPKRPLASGAAHGDGVFRLERGSVSNGEGTNEEGAAGTAIPPRPAWRAQGARHAQPVRAQRRHPAPEELKRSRCRSAACRCIRSELITAGSATGTTRGTGKSGASA